MMSDLSVGGVLVPGLLALALLALATTAALLRLLSGIVAWRRLAFRPLVEVSVFVILLGLLAQALTIIGPRP